MRPTISSDHGTTISTSIRKIDPVFYILDCHPDILINGENNRVCDPDIMKNFENSRVEKRPDSPPNHKNIRVKTLTNKHITKIAGPKIALLFLRIMKLSGLETLIF